MSVGIISILTAVCMILSGCMQKAGTVPQEKQDVEPEKVMYSDVLILAETYPHNPSSFTQGLFFYDGKMYESTGRYGKSKLYRDVDIKTGKAESEFAFRDDIFAEGSVVYKDRLYVLTYKENKVLIFDPETIEHTDTLDYPRQGWGLTSDGEYLIASDGTSELYYMDEKLNVIKNLTVKNCGREVKNINELEYIGGEIWANVWMSDEILIIDPQNGNVKKIIDFSGIYNHLDDNDPDNVLNGIAYNAESGKLCITGKCWDRVFVFELK